MLFTAVSFAGASRVPRPVLPVTLGVRLAQAVLVGLLGAVAPAALAAQQGESEADRRRAAYLAVVPPTVAARPGESARRRAEYLVEIPDIVDLASLGRRSAAPSISTGTPIGYGASFGDGFVGIGYQSQARNVAMNDGAVSIGTGLGDPSRWVGFEAVLTSLSTLRGDPGERMSLSVKVHRRFRATGAVALGVENAVHSPGTDGGQSLYLAASNFVQVKDDDSRPFASVAYTLGLGNGRFRPMRDLFSSRQSVNAFGSVSVRALPNLSVIADWGGQDLMLGASFVPFKRFGLVITPALADVLTRANNRVRPIVGIGYGRSFLKRQR